MDVKDKVVIVTGASAGIGREVAQMLAKLGAKVVLVARSQNTLESLSKHLPNSLAIPTDMTKAGQISSMVAQALKRYGAIDILVNNAGQGYDASVEKTDIDTFRHVFELDVIGPLIAMQQVIPIMKKQKRGLIINISSGTALMYLPNMAAYSAMKRALSAISLTAREELQDTGVSVSVMYPYITLTDFEKNTIKQADTAEQDWDENNENFQPPDTAQHVAQKILEQINNEKPEMYAHEWMADMH